MARAMKDSGIEWIGEIPEGWKVNRHKYLMHKEKSLCEKYNGEDIISLTMGGVIVRDLEAGGKMPTSFDGYQYVEPGDLLQCLFDIDVTPRCVGLVKSFGVTSPAYSRFKVHEGFSNAYYDYLLRTIDDEKVFVHLAKNLRSSLTETDFGALPSIVPPYEEQKRIVSFLDAECAKIDAVIEQTRASIEEYKKLKQSVITQAVTKGIRPGRKMKDSGVEWIGEIPEEWAVRPLKSFIDILPGYAFSSDDFNTDQGVRLLRGINVAPGSIRWDDVVYWNKEITDQIRQFELKEGDLVVGLDRPWISDGTRAAFVQERDLPCLLLQRVCRIRPNKDTDIRFVYHAIVGKSFEEALSTDTTGVSVPHISTKQIQQYLVAFPCKEEQMEISDFIDEKSANIDALIQKKQQFLAELESYKKSLIFEYVTGKKEVPG